MPEDNRQLQTEFQFGTTSVCIIQGNILDPPFDDGVEAVVSSDDNYLSMSSGVSEALRLSAASDEYIREAQTRCPTKAGTVMVTGAYGIKDRIPGVKHVLHATVIDYDTVDQPLEQLVYRTTSNCLREAQDRGLRSVLFPALGTGSGGLPMATCARQMCGAIKAYLAEERALDAVYLMLFHPDSDDETAEPAAAAASEERNRRFITEANLVLDLPYDPTSGVRQCRDFHGRDAELKQLERIITGQLDDEAGKRHAVIAGGPAIGKQALLDQIHCRARQPGTTLSEGRCVVRVTFGHVHRNTPTSFVYRKFLCALDADEKDDHIRAELKRAYANPDVDSERFLALLEEHKDHYGEVVFLVDHLPKLLRMEPGEADKHENVLAFWKDLDRLQERVRFVCTAREEEYETLQEERLTPLTESFYDRIEVLHLGCISDEERRGWIDALFKRYLGRPHGAPEVVHTFVQQEAGQHPYLISLVGYSLVEGLKRDALMSSMPVKAYDRSTLEPFLQASADCIEAPRRVFFESLLTDSAVGQLERQNLKNLAKAVADEQESQRLLPGIDIKDPDAIERWHTLLAQDNPRLSLDQTVLQRLERRGYLVDAEDRNTVQFMASSFADWLKEYFGLADRRQDQPQDVLVGFLNPEPHVLTTLFGQRGARLLSAQKRLAPEIRDKFVGSFRDCISHLLHPTRHPASGAFRDLEEVANFVLTYFTTDAIKSYLQDPPEDATILLAVDEAMKDVPWELVLETSYGGEIPYPFIVGRTIVTGQTPHAIGRLVRGQDRVRALLIGNPTDDLDDAETETLWLRNRLRRDGRFVVRDEDVRIGPDQCRWLSLLDTLSSGRYGLIHYSGHTTFDGYQSAWHVKDGKITTDLLTSALQNAPPALVFSSSCESGVGAEARRAEYENQTFDLPSAFLQAGVEAYIGTLWEVNALAARWFVEGFYNAFLSGHGLGKCLQQAKIAIRGNTYRTDRLAFILYGDPHLSPGDMFPALSGEEN